MTFCSKEPNKTKPPLQDLAVVKGNSEKVRFSGIKHMMGYYSQIKICLYVGCPTYLRVSLPDPISWYLLSYLIYHMCQLFSIYNFICLQVYCSYFLFLFSLSVFPVGKYFYLFPFL
jgi:hypothetical protein